MTHRPDSPVGRGADPNARGPAGVHPLRARPAVRGLLHRSLLQPEDLLFPALVQTSRAARDATDVPACTIEAIPAEARRLRDLRIAGVEIFAAAGHKDRLASDAVARDNLMTRAIRAFKDAAPELCVCVETCLCAYTDSGDCAIVADGRVDVPRTCATLGEMAVAQAAAGADVVAVSGMVNGAVGAVRTALDAAGFHGVPVMAHVIFDSSLYDGYRRAVRAVPASGHRRGFQVDPSQPRQAIAQALSFLDEGADLLLLEPAIPTIDVLVELRSVVRCPLGAFSVSGEYQRFRPTRADGLDARAMLEFLGPVKRGGADFILTYAAPDLAALLRRESTG